MIGTSNVSSRVWDGATHVAGASLDLAKKATGRSGMNGTELLSA